MTGARRKPIKPAQTSEVSFIHVMADPAVVTKRSSMKQPSQAHPTYSEMVARAILDMKERKGSSRLAITRHVASSFKLSNPDAIQRSVNAALKKMTAAGILVAGALGGRKGAGCFKLAPEEKARRLKAGKKTAKSAKKAVKAPKKVAKKKPATKSKVAKKTAKAPKKKPSSNKPEKKPSVKKVKPSASRKTAK